jgi:hypothetical protein
VKVITRRCSPLVLLWLALIVISTPDRPCSAGQDIAVPPLLEPWVEWVLHDKQQLLSCISNYNDYGTRVCSWPSELEMNLDETGGRFRQSWLVHHQSWVSLPGNNSHWPQDVFVDGNPAIILNRDGVPQLRLEPGSHTIKGNFSWTRLPENLQIPPASALVILTVADEKIPFPELDAHGLLWLRGAAAKEKTENRLKIESFRHIDDSIPAVVTLYFTLDVAGAAREINLGLLYEAGTFIPLSLQSSLPAKLEEDGKMVVQVRPGQYTIRLRLRHDGPLREISFVPPAHDFWPQQEIWSFQSRPDLRLVEISGAVPIDPLQASVPAAWQELPAYRLLPGEVMAFTEIKRGDPHPAPDQLSLKRKLWLRFDGSGYTIQDHISGWKNSGWRLDIDPAITLGRVAVDGEEQFITRAEGSESAGVELRSGVLNLVADSSYTGKISRFPATGWEHDFQKVTGELLLPPGWKIIYATGIDNIPGTWLKRWTLLDIFIVLIFTIALAKIFSKSLASVAFITLVINYHQPGAPGYIWLALLIGYTLLKYLPDGKFKKAVRVYQILAILSLIAIVIPYAVTTLRVGIFPQLAQPWVSMNQYSLQNQKASLRTDLLLDNVQQQMETASIPELKEKTMNMSSPATIDSTVRSKTSSFQSPGKLMQHDPKALTQTGPGMPGWQAFQTITFSWSGPVTQGQDMSFTLIGPKVNLVLAFVRILLILVLALGMLGISYRPPKSFSFSGFKSQHLFPLVLLLSLLPLAPQSARSSEIPPPEMLAELQQRLLEKAECFPACADISAADITIDDTLLSLKLHVDAQLDTAIPIPGHVQQWLPWRVMLDEQPAEGLLRRDGGYWMLVTAGRHIVQLSGAIREQNTLQLSFPLQPHQIRINAEGWLVEGGLEDGSFDSQLQFKRLADSGLDGAGSLETGILPAFVLVERNLMLGLEWKVQTRVQRISPLGSGIVLDIPLIPGESVTTDGLRVVDGVAKINLAADSKYIVWESFLEPTNQLLLKHQQTTSWTEIWRVDVSPIFHMQYQGIPVILHKTGNLWLPVWHPWPGETVLLTISRPAGVEGQTLTIEKSHLELRPGRNTTAAKLFLSISSSQGGQHSISLPEDAKLQEVRVKGKIRPIRQDGEKVVLSITPGQQDIELQWIESRGMSAVYRSSDVDLESPSVNASVDLYLPRDRWPLFVGGQQLMGPAVLFWSVLIIVVLVAFGLSRTGWTPLRFHHWVLLGIGLSMSQLFVGFIVVGWLMALDRRGRAIDLQGRFFNASQIGLAVLTVAAVGSLVLSISFGLLGHPDMNIVGNGSNSSLLRWYQDISDQTLPQAWVVSIPMLYYRLAMLLWALWISFWLVGVLKWGWQQYTFGKIWESRPKKNDKGSRFGKSSKPKQATEQPPESSASEGEQHIDVTLK